ncbi:Paraquat-inducible protein A [Ketogulonicigenium robustum]|uniref:Paraquat-inducible protein A n=1 Tax=Ketogulonicigenium robustum TaxID=92947 RepID=A0A1W6NYI7_9RHOB|nr:Paraquat-inducible protein A [Ketogulonicigenium robustum]
MIVTAAAIFFPILKILGIAMVQFGLMDAKLAPLMSWIGKFAMADIFLLSLYVLIFKGMGVGEVRVGWGMYLFTFCVVASIVISALTEKLLKAKAA